MRIVTWNCQMAFRKKKDKILSLNPDIIVIQECESPIKKKDMPTPISSQWIGDNENKGVFVCTYNPNISIKLNPMYNNKFKYIVPLNIKFYNYEFIIFAVWTKHTGKIYTSYIVQLYRALNYYSKILSYDTIIIGDFNSSKIWDNGDKKEATHSDTVQFLQQYDIASLYHLYFDEYQGKETQPTLYFQKKQDKKFHIDYCFAGKFWTKKLQNIEIGKYNDWIEYSDHVPIIIDFE